MWVGNACGIGARGCNRPDSRWGRRPDYSSIQLTPWNRRRSSVRYLCGLGRSVASCSRGCGCRQRRCFYWLGQLGSRGNHRPLWADRRSWSNDDRFGYGFLSSGSRILRPASRDPVWLCARRTGLRGSLEMFRLCWFSLRGHIAAGSRWSCRLRDGLLGRHGLGNCLRHLANRNSPDQERENHQRESGSRDQYPSDLQRTNGFRQSLPPELQTRFSIATIHRTNYRFRGQKARQPIVEPLFSLLPFLSLQGRVRLIETLKALDEVGTSRALCRVFSNGVGSGYRSRSLPPLH